MEPQENAAYPHPADVESMAEFAEGTGAEVLRGGVRYPSDSGGCQLVDIDLSEHLDKYRDHEVVIVVASVGRASEIETERCVCGICGFALTELGECL